jgi:hypothetical protein
LRRLREYAATELEPHMNGLVSRFTTFDKLIATSLIKVLYWIGIAFIVVGVVGGMLAAFTQGFGYFIGSPFVGIIALILWRFTCELWIVTFGMYDRLGEIQKSLAQR